MLIQTAETWDHPRIRGKDTVLTRTEAILQGSPPHTRERHSLQEEQRFQCRITPAYAGKTLCLQERRQYSRDHPRIRGKDIFIFGGITSESGSPPHTRERPAVLTNSLSLSGITPAYAGKTMKIIGNIAAYRDHPRIRGKDASKDTQDNDSVGSPPHTRERRCGSCSDISSLGITPAYAGKTSLCSRPNMMSKDHPRIRGKDSIFNKGRQGALWITPAYAGKTVISNL